MKSHFFTAVVIGTMQGKYSHFMFQAKWQVNLLNVFGYVFVQCVDKGTGETSYY